MRLATRKGKFVCALLTVILSGVFSLASYSRTMNPNPCLQKTGSPRRWTRKSRNCRAI